MKKLSRANVLNFYATIDLMEFGIALMRQNISRSLPGATQETLDRELQCWLSEQPEVVVSVQHPAGSK